MQQTTTHEITSEPTLFDNPRTLTSTTKNLAFNEENMKNTTIIENQINMSKFGYESVNANLS